MAITSFDEAFKSVPKTSTWTKLTYTDRWGEENNIQALRFKVKPKNVATDAVGIYLESKKNHSGAGVGFVVHITIIYGNGDEDTNPLGKFPTEALAKKALKDYIAYAVGSKEAGDLVRMAFD